MAMDYHDEISQLEPDVFGLLKKLHDGTSYSGIQTASIVSIAISLKRIADELCGVPYNYEPGADNSQHRVGLTQGIQIAIEQGLAATSQRG